MPARGTLRNVRVCPSPVRSTLLLTPREPGTVSLPLTPTFLVGLTIVVLVAGTINGLAGFGFALVGTMALASVVDPATAVVFMILPILAVNLTLIGELSSGELRTCGRRFAPLLLSALVGTLIGLVLIDVLPADPLRLVLGIVSLGFVLTSSPR